MKELSEIQHADKLVPVSEAARFLGVSPTTLYRYDKSGVLNAYRTAGGHRRYSLSELANFLVESRKTANGVVRSL